jgi:hypothetical protein
LLKQLRARTVLAETKLFDYRRGDKDARKLLADQL